MQEAKYQKVMCGGTPTDRGSFFHKRAWNRRVNFSHRLEKYLVGRRVGSLELDPTDDAQADLSKGAQEL